MKTFIISMIVILVMVPSVDTGVCCIHETKFESVDGIGSVYVYPNTVSYDDLIRGMFIKQEYGLTTDGIRIPITVGGHIFDKLKDFVLSTEDGEDIMMTDVSESFIVVSGQRFDVELNLSGNFEIEIDLVGPQKINNWSGLNIEVTLHYINSKGREIIVGITNVTIINIMRIK